MQPLLAEDPERVGNYRLIGRLGRGAMGTVYLARSRGGRAVAVKVVGGELAGDPAFRERFRREIQSVRAVGGFWTAPVVDADPDAARPWLATEYVPGPTLQEAVAAGGPLPERGVRILAAGLAEALVAIHSAGVVHRDVKPGNILIGADGPRVIDFGISRVLEHGALTATGMFLGTPGFFSPEQVNGDEVGPASDVFSLGALLVFAATGSGPFGDGPTAAMLYRVVHAEPDLERVPPGLRGLLAACLAKDPARRPTPEQLLGLLGPVDAVPAAAAAWLPAPVTRLIDAHVQLTTRALTRAAEPAPTPADKPPTRVFQPEQAEPPPRAKPQPARAAPRPRQAAPPDDQPGRRRLGRRPVRRALVAWFLTALALSLATNGLRQVVVSALICLLLVFGAATWRPFGESFLIRHRLLVAFALPVLPALLWSVDIGNRVGPHPSAVFALCYLAHAICIATFVNATVRTPAPVADDRVRSRG